MASERSEEGRVGVAVLGSTGSIGVSTLDVIARHADRFRVEALSARGRIDVLWEQIVAFRPRKVVLADARAAATLREWLAASRLTTTVHEGDAGLREVVEDPAVDTVMAAIVGAAGLRSTLEAVAAGKRVLLANKEALVMAGGLIMATARNRGATLLPIDSEHNAIFQCLPACAHTGTAQTAVAERGVERLLLTASGGPFLRHSPEALARVTPAQACAHPNWSMGRKISVDSATMMNKGLEVIEACWLFGVEAEQIEVVVHPQSVIHSMVRYIDGSVLAELGHADMRTPIAHGLAWPDRIDAGVEALDPTCLGALDFEPPDPERFPALGLALAAARAGGTAGARLNAANEVAVAHFLEARLHFPDIARVVAEVMDHDAAVGNAESLEGLLEADADARRLAETTAARLQEGPRS